jgi:hypothetical protein
VRVAPDEPSGRRRTVYTLLDRERLESVFRVFDFPSPELSSARRARTIVPQQALFLLNSRFVATQAQALANALAGVRPTQFVERVEGLYRRLYQRDPDAQEMRLARAFLALDRPPKLAPQIIVTAAKAAETEGAASTATVSSVEGLGPERLTPWGVYAQALLQANEFLFVD